MQVVGWSAQQMLRSYDPCPPPLGIDVLLKGVAVVLADMHGSSAGAGGRGVRGGRGYRGPSEVLLLTASELVLCRDATARSVTLNLHHLQLDDLSPGTKFPVVLCPADSGFNSAQREAGFNMAEVVAQRAKAAAAAARTAAKTAVARTDGGGLQASWARDASGGGAGTGAGAGVGGSGGASFRDTTQERQGKEGSAGDGARAEGVRAEADGLALELGAESLHAQPVISVTLSMYNTDKQARQQVNQWAQRWQHGSVGD